MCTANVARSPLFAARLQLEAGRRGVADAVSITSAGTDAVYGQPAAKGSLVVAERWGTDLGDHVARPLAYASLAEQSLVITMTREQRRAVRRDQPAGQRKTFALQELATLTKRLPRAAPRTATTDSGARITAVADLASQNRPGWLSRRRLDIPDPIGGDQAVYDQLGEQFVAIGVAIGELLFGPVDGRE